MNVEYKGQPQEIIDEYMEIGYMAEAVEMTTLDGETKVIGRQSSDRAIQLFVSFPELEEFEEEIIAFDHYFDDLKVELQTYLIFASSNDFVEQLAPKLTHLKIVIDSEDEYANMYGTVIVNGLLKDKLTKSLFIIGKDGAVFYEEFPPSLETSFKLELLVSELNRAFVAYTGVGCHG
jgi:peroxiredoxin